MASLISGNTYSYQPTTQESHISVDEHLEHFLQQTLQSLKSSYVYSIHNESRESIRTVWSKPTVSKPVSRVVINVFFKLDEKRKPCFSLENNKFNYYNINEINFDRALDMIIQGKLAAKGAGIHLNI
jgi:hypothetical protein